ncbi:MAG: SDR family oxidoreductase [Bacteroidia bacterium]|nr:SDR family oxidoreductase [Bacteroidia bacterium]
MGLLDGKRLVVIGGTSGIGLAAALAFRAHGAQVVVSGLDEGSCAAAAEALGPEVPVLCRDASSEGTAEEVIAACVSRWGDLDGLYHVAGGSGRRYGDGPLHTLSLEGWDKTLALNLTSVMLSSRAAVRHWLDRERGGSLLLLGSVLGYSPSPRYFVTHGYAAAKAAMIGLAASLAASYASYDIRVNVLAPGLTETPMAQRAVQNPEILDFVRTKQPLGGGRAGQPADLAGAALYFMADLSAFVTGQVLAVDGGWSVSEGQVVS